MDSWKDGMGELSNFWERLRGLSVPLPLFISTCLSVSLFLSLYLSDSVSLLSLVHSYR